MPIPETTTRLMALSSLPPTRPCFLPPLADRFAQVLNNPTRKLAA
jgi:hypothetical protein